MVIALESGEVLGGVGEVQEAARASSHSLGSRVMRNSWESSNNELKVLRIADFILGRFCARGPPRSSPSQRVTGRGRAGEDGKDRD
jgi:hypothetical protein